MLPAALAVPAPSSATSVPARRVTVEAPKPSESATPRDRPEPASLPTTVPPWRRERQEQPGGEAPVFFEFFAGDAQLSLAMKEMGLRIRADDLVFGGTDFLDPVAVENAKREIEQENGPGEASRSAPGPSVLHLL